MTTVGDAHLWTDVFPNGLVPRIIDLVWDTWKSFEKPRADEHEVPITRRFKRDLKRAKDYRRLPVRIEREPVEDDPETGAVLGRIDIKFVPAESALEEVYFAFECKRLYAWVNGTWEALASRYVSQGMARFVAGRYAARMSQGGMIGYVLNGDCERARQQVEQSVVDRRVQLRMASRARLRASSVRAGVDDIRETVHRLDDGRLFVLHHLFLAVPVDALARNAGESHGGCAT